MKGEFYCELSRGGTVHLSGRWKDGEQASVTTFELTRDVKEVMTRGSVSYCVTNLYRSAVESIDITDSGVIRIHMRFDDDSTRTEMWKYVRKMAATDSDIRSDYEGFWVGPECGGTNYTLEHPYSELKYAE